MSTTPLQLFQAGKLKEAIAAVIDQLRKQPNDYPARAFLCELSCFAGDLEKADRQSEMLSTDDPQVAVHVAMFRHLLRAEQCRQKFYTDGAVPEFLEQPDERMEALLHASISIREKKLSEAAALLNVAYQLYPRVKGTCDGQPFEGFRDLDDFTATFFEVLAPNGKYYWVPMEKVKSLDFQPHQRPRDLMWRRAKLVLKDGMENDVMLPAIYFGSHAESDQRIAVGQMTDWRGGEGSPVRGVGQRMYLIGENDVPFLEMKSLVFEG